MTTAGPSYRHHPYSKQTSSRSHPAPRTHSPNVAPHIPPSPPRSRRDPSETPSAGVGLGVAFGGSTGGKWWDEELPPPPASLTAILDSFRKSGEGDRELLLSILGAKKAEEERLTALIQTRLTILQARLSLHSAAAAVNAQSQGPTEQEYTSQSQTQPREYSRSPRVAPTQVPMQVPVSTERTPSLSSSRSPGGTSVTSDLASPPLPLGINQGYMQPPANPASASSEDNQKRERMSFWQLPPPRLNQNHKMEPSGGQTLPPIVVEPYDRASHSRSISPINRDRDAEPKRQRRDTSGSGSSGIDMLLDAGMRVDSGEC